MPLRDLGPFPSIQVVPPRHAPEGMDLAGEVQTRVSLGGSVGVLTNHGGPVLAHPKLVALYAGQFWADRAKNDAFLTDLCTAGYEAAARFQGVNPGQYLGGFTVPAPTKSTLLDSEIQQFLHNVLAQRADIPQPDSNTLYMLILPSGVSAQFDGSNEFSCANFCGYHSNMGGTAYAVQTATDCSGCNEGDAVAGFTAVQAHEYIEACTDPLGNGWYNDQTGAENADEAAWALFAWGPHTVQGYAALVSGQWVNAVGVYTPVQQPKPPPPVWQPDPALQAFYADWAAAARWCVAAYAAAKSPADATRVATYARAVITACDSWQAYLGRPGTAISGNMNRALPESPR